MARPVALIGKKRDEVVALLGRLGDRELGRRFGVNDKTIAKIRRESTPKTAKRGVTGAMPPTGEIDPAQILDDDLRIRMELRDGLLSDFRRSREPRERAVIARELATCLDQVRKVLSDPGPGTRGDAAEDVEADAFDSYMMRIVEKARIVVAAEPAEEPPERLPLEAEPARDLGA